MRIQQYDALQRLLGQVVHVVGIQSKMVLFSLLGVDMGEPVAWMFRGYLYEKDPSDWTVHEHPDVPVIPLYTHPAKTLTDEDVLACASRAKHSKLSMTTNEFYILFAKELFKETNNG